MPSRYRRPPECKLAGRRGAVSAAVRRACARDRARGFATGSRSSPG